MTFDEFKFDPGLAEAIAYMGFEKATPIQEKSIPEIISGKDLIGCAQTGTGKTAAFVLPVINNLIDKDLKGIKAVIIVPTRELAIQIDQQIQGFSYFTSITSLPVYGGGDGAGWDTERNAITGDTSILVVTPGKMLAHLKMGYVQFDELEYLILDEADKMLDMGFYNDIMQIISHMPKKRQTIMFSATMPPKIRTLAKDILQKPVEITMELSKPADGVLQAVYLTYDPQKTALISSLIADKEEYTSILIFTSTKSKVFEIVRDLNKNKLGAEAISSDLDQKEREEVLTRYRSKQTRVLVATDVLSRGIDIKEIDLVINYDVPGDAEDYVHRVGRTARASATGVALTLVNEKEMPKFKRIEELIDAEIIKLKVPEELGESPEWKVFEARKSKKKFYNKKKNFKGKPGKKN
ncbi:MAG: DEAD/DEAH box helicase, partial [Bacteroidales bacterium]|nr:DEAD/DEAH box helicase [Bacteroidales bacterium]